MCDIYNAGPPICQSLEIAGLLVEGQRLSFNAAYSGGCDSAKYTFVLDTKPRLSFVYLFFNCRERGDCDHEWFRVNDNGIKKELGKDGEIMLSYLIGFSFF